MGTILDIHNPWRDALKPASFRGASFFCEVGNKSNGRRIVVHEFPKKDTPYSEDLGRRAKTFTVRAYCIMSSRRGKDYRPMRDALVSALEQNGPGKLQLPTIPAEQVAVTRYRLTEDEKLGGYCVFEIEFVEAGAAPGALAPSTNTAGALNSSAEFIQQLGGGRHEMNRLDTYEAIPIINRLCTNLASIIVDKGAAGANARVALGDVIAFAKQLCASNDIGPALNTCFDMVRLANCTVQQMMTVRDALEAELTPKTIGATHVKNYSIYLALGHAAKIVATMVFISREDVEIVLQRAQQPFSDAIETAADEMDQMMFQNLIALQSALTNHLVTTARPLPQMLRYQFADVLPSLVIAHRLYADASRADDIRSENKIVHPAFCPVAGRALSS